MQKLLSKFNLLAQARSSELLKYGIAAILIAVPLYPKFPFLNIPGIYVSIRIEDFLILGVTLIWFLQNYNKLKDLWKNNIVRAIVLFLAVGLIATLSGIIFLHTASLTVGMLSWARRLEYLLGFFIAFTSIKSIRDIEFYVKCIGIVLFIVFIFGLGQKYFNFPVITTQNQEYSKGIALRFVPGTQLVSTFAGHYDLAAFVLLTSPILISILFSKKESLKQFLGMKEKLARIIILVLIAISFWMMVNAASRITVLAYVISLSITLLVIRKQKYIPIVFIATVIFAIGTSNLFDRYLNIFNVIKDKLSDIIAPPVYAQSNVLAAATSIEDRSTSIRLNVEWPRAIRAFLKNPLLGTGYSSATLATDNDYLRALAETGILGFVSFGMIFFRIGMDFLKKAWPANAGKHFGILSKKELDFRTCFLAGVIGAIPGVLINVLFIDLFEASKFAIPFWILMGLTIAIIARRETQSV